MGVFHFLLLSCLGFATTAQGNNCGSAGKVENGVVDYPEGTSLGHKVVISCNTGYKLVGRNEIYCKAGGWGDRLPVCEAVTCEPPPEPKDASYSPVNEIYKYRDAIRYTCIKDYTLNGTKTASCSENGKFEPNPPTCVKVSCNEPDVPNGEFVEGARPPYGYQASVTYKCKPGYSRKGDASFTCGINSRWSPEPPTCNNGNKWKKDLGIALGVSWVVVVVQYYLL